ncbi:hypothetical protein [Microbacterium maritypicum]|nr:hypothetical protein [Microbacterium liquefaciens]
MIRWIVKRVIEAIEAEGVHVRAIRIDMGHIDWERAEDQGVSS